jgi:hypothetical protein
VARTELPEDIGSLTYDELQDLVQDMAKRWLAHDGLWFQAVERAYGLEEAIRLDAEAWHGMTRNEAQRIVRFLGAKPGGGLDLLERALRFRLYALLNDQEMEREGEDTLVFRMRTCRVQEARRRKGLPDFPCKPVGLVEYSGFAETIDPRIRTEVIACPPDAEPRDYACAWRFTITESKP